MKINKRGFTLMEAVLVVVIMAILAVIAVPSVSGVLNNANRSVDNANARLYESALKIYVSQKAQLREYVTIAQMPGQQDRVANSIAAVIDDGVIRFACKTRDWAFYYHPVTLQVVTAEYPEAGPAGMIPLMEEGGQPITGDPSGALLVP